MLRHLLRPLPRRGALRAVAVTAALALGGSTLALTGVAPAQAANKVTQNKVTPGNFTGYGFDQCLTPTQAAMDTWLENSPYLAVGIYVSGDSRACRYQPNLTPTWVSTQLARGWKLLPIALGPQASCHPSFPRYEGDVVIDPTPGSNGRYDTARALGRIEAAKSVRDTAALGITKGSTIWYDLEHFDVNDTHCRESAMAFMSEWVKRVEALGYVSGMYGGASSSLKMLDDARVERPGQFRLPEYIWIARWDGKANTKAEPYLRPDGWLPGRRMKQYKGDHVRKYGGVAINIDSNWLDLGKGSRASTNKRCGVKEVTNLPRYLNISSKKKTQTKKRVKAVQCLLKERGYKGFKVSGKYGSGTKRAVKKFRVSQGLSNQAVVTRTTWIRLLSARTAPVLKVGSSGAAVHKLQQSLAAAGVRKEVSTGLFDKTTSTQVKAYQKRLKLSQTGVAGTTTWAALKSGQA